MKRFHGLLSFASFARAALLSLVALVVLPFGCSSTGGERDGFVELIASTRQGLSASDVARVRITVSGADIATPIVEDLVKVGATWRGSLRKIPAGTDRSFHGDAFDATNTVVYAGDATGVAITRGATALVAILLQEVRPPPPFRNEAPRIDSVTAAALAVAPGESVSLAATAHDPNPADVLTYAWSATAGTFADASMLATSWTSPPGEGPVTITLRVTDAKGGLAAISLRVDVAASHGKGSAAVSADFNTWPEVTRVVADPGRLDVGETARLSATALDVDGDALTYSWATTCIGAFDDPASRTPSFTVSATPAPTCELTVTVTDGARGGSNHGTLGVAIGPAPLADVAPVVDSAFQSSEYALEGDRIILRVGAHDPNGSGVTTTWSADSGTLGAPLENEGSSEVVWTAPACTPGAAPTVTATISDGTTTTTEVFSVPVWCASAEQIFVEDQEIVTNPYTGVGGRWWTYRPFAGFDPTLGTLKKVRVVQQASWSFHDGPTDDYYEMRLYVLGAFIGGDLFASQPNTTVSKTYTFLRDGSPDWHGDRTYYAESYSENTPHHFASTTTFTFLYEPAAPTRAIYDFSGSDQEFVVPTGTTSVWVSAWGAGGGGGGELADHNAGSGGAGGFAESAIAVSPGETLTVIVGGGGDYQGGATYGGGGASTANLSGAGGGRSALRRGATELITGGGGGGGSLVQAWTGVTPHGGAAGEDAPASGSAAGAAGTSTGGGAGAAGGQDGGPFAGGNGGGWHGGGGGGGFYGGGGGGGPTPPPFNGGGGGGSSHAPAGLTLAGAGAAPPRTTSSVYSAGVAVGGAPARRGGHGRVVIQW